MNLAPLSHNRPARLAVSGGGRARLEAWFALFCLWLAAGCATLPRTVPVPESEASSIRGQFKERLRDQGACPAALDADVSVSVRNLLWDGAVSGYLRAMAPDYLRFEAVNPLGLTEALAAADGERFSYIAVREQAAYQGPLSSDFLSRYLPDGLATSLSYYWLLGGVTPGAMNIESVGRDQEGRGYWLDLSYPALGRRTEVLFVPGQPHLLIRSLVLNSHDAVSLELSYVYPPLATPAACQLPAKITIHRPGNGSLVIDFTKRYPTPPLDVSQFRLTPPAGYKRIEVK
ncbi:MAG: hypothetical protein M0T76_10910 [Desulfobacteraceae bacterium]|nr:hypothetical protein [Desulfobacteraceae bacterium]